MTSILYYDSDGKIIGCDKRDLETFTSPTSFIELDFEPDGTIFTDYNFDIATLTLTKKPQEEIDAQNLIEYQEAQIKAFTAITNKIIQDDINLYNQNNGTAFDDINSFAKYAIISTGEHYLIATSYITWVDSVWKTARDIQANVLSEVIMLPTDLEYIEMIPKRV